MEGVGTVRQLIEEMAASRPDQTFLISPESGRRVSFGALREQADVLESRLFAMGLRRRDRVALMLENGVHTAQLLLGAIYAGFVAVPLNLRAGAAPLAAVLDHCGPKIVFVSAGYLALLEEVLALTARKMLVAQADPELPWATRLAGHTAYQAPAPAPWDAAMLVYTSGSTGQVNSAIHTHRSILAHARNAIGAEPSPAILPLHAMNADCAALIPALLGGNPIMVPRGDPQADPAPGGIASPAWPAMEALVAELWRSLLGQADLGPESNFFACGGQSLQAIECLSLLRAHTGVQLSLADFFANPTISRLALQAAAALPGAAAGPAPAAVPAVKRGRFCLLSPAQERIWFMEQFNTGEPMYNEAEAVRLKGPLDTAALRRAFNRIVARHEILRSTIAFRASLPEAEIHENWPIKFRTLDLRGRAPAAAEAELARLLTEEPRRRYDLQAEPGIRVTLVQLGHQDHALILMMHHIVCDSSSIGVLWRELGALYAAECEGSAACLPELPIQHADYAAWQRNRNTAAGLAFWRQTLQGAPLLLDQPTDRPRPAICSFRGTRRRFEFGAPLAEALRQLCRRQRATMFVVFAAALNTLLYRYTLQDDILLGIPVADRQAPELRPLIGFLLDTHALRVRPDPEASFAALLAQVGAAVAALYTHRAVPFDQVVAALQPERDLSRTPLFQVMLSWRDREDQPQFIGLPGLLSEPLLAHSRTAKFDLTIALTDAGDRILAEAEYNTDLFDDPRIERLFGHLAVLLEAAAANPAQKLSEITMLTEAERQMLLCEWTMEEVDEAYS